jgi:ABC transporter DrrB family efflux protein
VTSTFVPDAAAITRRNLITIRRVPQLLVFATIQPIIFVLLFNYVFGGAIPVPGVDYVDYLMPGIFVQVVAFGAITTGIGLAEDLSKGLIERFRSLPMARSAVLVGRTLADLVRNVFVQSLMVLVGFLVGYRFYGGLPRFLVAMAVLLLFGFALSWMFALIGLSTANAETTQAAAFPVVAPLVFASNAFVPIQTMPDWLQTFARNQPVSVVISAVRSLSLDAQQAAALGLTDSRWTYVVKALAWIVALVALFAPIAVARYRRST